MLLRRVSFVCTGNICRSPMAEYLFRALAPKHWNIEANSYGTMTLDGRDASNNAVVAAMEEGVDLSPHHSRALRPAELRESDLILTMTESHKMHIHYAMPDLMDKTFCLSEFGKNNRKGKDVEDPIGGNLGVYRRSFKQIRKEIERIMSAVGDYFGLE